MDSTHRTDAQDDQLLPHPTGRTRYVAVSIAAVVGWLVLSLVIMAAFANVAERIESALWHDVVLLFGFVLLIAETVFIVSYLNRRGYRVAKWAITALFAAYVIWSIAVNVT